MGAFGELLIRSFGGDLDYYRGDSISQNPKPKTKIEIERDNREKDEDRLEQVIGSSSLLLERYKLMKSHLIDVKDVDVETIFKTDKARIKFKKWRAKFLIELNIENPTMKNR